MHAIIPLITSDQRIVIQECGVATEMRNSWSRVFDWAVERKGSLREA